MFEYPSSIVWMIECRHWPDEEDVLPNQPIDKDTAWMSYAQPEPVEFGSGVVIKLEHLDNNDQPQKPRIFKNYILTCRHVVRTGVHASDPAFKEIICWKPGKEYDRTLPYNHNESEGRLKRHTKRGYIATVSDLSPNEDSSCDWALLELSDTNQRYSFDKEINLKAGKKGKAGSKIRIIGYPHGAGIENDRRREGANYWFSGDTVESFRSRREKIDKVEGEKLRYRGDVESRPGMSGGGVFQTFNHTLVGLHNSRHEDSLIAHALNYSDITDWLLTHRHVKPVYKRPVRDWKWWAVIVGVLAIAGCLLVTCDSSPRELPELSYARLFGAVEVPFLINGGVVPNSQNGPEGTLGHFDFNQTLDWWKADPTFSSAKFLRDPVFSKVQAAYQNMEGYYPFDNSLWKIMAGKNDALLRAMYASLDPSLPLEKVPADYERAIQIFSEKGWLDAEFRGDQVDFAKRTLDSSLKDIGYLFLCIKIPKEQSWDSMKVTYKYWPAQSLGEERKPKIKMVERYKAQELQLPVNLKDSILMWLIEVYRKDSDGYETMLLGDVVLPENLILQQGKATYSVPIRLPLRDQASKVSIPIGWYQQ